jgi:hypothetical protein
MAELSDIRERVREHHAVIRATEPPAEGCCSPDALAACCAPGERADCCGTHSAESPARCNCEA